MGRRVFVHSSGVAFWGADEKLCSALTDENGNLYDFIIEAELSSHLWNVAILGNDCFWATSDGLLRFSLSEFEQGSAQMDLLCDNSIYDGFSIYQDQIYLSIRIIFDAAFTIWRRTGTHSLWYSGL